jgi:hypothetical protein
MRLTTIAVLAVLCGCMARQQATRYDAPPTSVLASQRQSYADDDGGGAMAGRDDGAEEVVLTSSAAPESAVFSGVSAVGSLFSGTGGAQGPATAQPVASATPKETAKLVIEAWIEMQIDDVAAAAAAIRTRVEAAGGRVVSENIIGPASAASSAALELRIPPAHTVELQTWLGTLGVIESRRVLASDVSKTLFDQELALQNLQLTMDRLQKLAEKDLPMKELLELEKEMTRVRGQIERIKGEQRWLLDRVAYSTITLTLKREGGPIEFAPHARIRPGVHLATLSLLDPDADAMNRPRSRVGGGVSIYVRRFFTLDLDVFPAKGGDSRAVIGTIGGALYSSFLGGGRRRFGNPYLGLRGGYGYLSGEQCGVLGGELGIELFKHKYLQVEVAARAVAFLRDDHTDVALHTQLGFAVPF